MIDRHYGHLARDGRDYDEADHYAATCSDAAAPDDLVSQILWRSVRAHRCSPGRARAKRPSSLRAPRSVCRDDGGDRVRGDTLFDLAEVFDLAGRRDEAIHHAREALRLYEEKGVVPSIRRVRSFLAAEPAARS